MQILPKNSCIQSLLITTLFVLGGPAFAERPASGFADPVLGRWDLTVDTGNATYPSWLEVSLRTEWQLMGRFVGQFGSARHITAIAYDDGKLEFRVPAQYEQNTEELYFVGKLDGDQITGTTVDNSGKTIAWAAVRAPALESRHPRRWGDPLELWDGRSLEGWRPRSGERTDCWSIEDKLLKVTPPCVDLISERSFQDFNLRAEFSYPPGSNSGIYLRGRYEVQIQDDFGKAVDPLRVGGVYGFLAPSVNAAHRADEWQVLDISLIGRRITVELNGVTVIDNRVVPGITGGALDSNEGLPGPLMLQGDHGPISFRKITLTPAK